MTEQIDVAAIKREVRARTIATLASSTGMDCVTSLAATCEITSLSPAQIWRQVAAGTFPQPVALSAGRRGWLMSELQAWIAQRKAERDTGVNPRRSPHLVTGATQDAA